MQQLLKNLVFQPIEHWGPQSKEREQFKHIPVGFYNRFQKIGKEYCDLSSLLNKRTQEEGDQFIKVKTLGKKPIKNPTGTKIKVFIRTRAEQKNQQTYKYYSQKWTKTYVRAKQATKTKFKESITVKNDWNKTGNIQPNFQKEITEKVNFQCFREVGILRELKPEIEKISRKQYKLDFKQCNLYTHFTDKDKVLKGLAMKYLEEQPKKRTVILLPQFLTAIMTLRFGQYPWHISVLKQGNTLIMNSHQNDLTYLDLYAVNENTQNNMPDEARVMDNCRMATQVAKSFKEQICSGKIIQQQEYVKEEWEEDEEEQQEEVDTSESFKKYMKIGLGDIDLFTYVEVDGAKNVEDPRTQQQYTKYYLTKSLIETETNYEWKNKFEKSGAGHVISGEYLSNSVNWQKWLIESELSGAQHFKISYISQNQDSVFNILNVMQLTSKNINQNTRFNIKKCWNVLKTVVESLFEGNDGTYILLKSAYQTNLNVFQIPQEYEQEN